MRKRLIMSMLGFLCVLTFSLQADTALQKRRKKRLQSAEKVKEAVVRYCTLQPIQKQTTNGDEKRYSDYRASFGKGLERNPDGSVKPQAFLSMVRALRSGKPSDFAAIQIAPGGHIRLANPQASFCYSLVCHDSWAPAMATAPAFASEETAAEMIELYWSALLRDVPFNQFGQSEIAQAAMDELSRTHALKSPRKAGKVTPGVLFRGNSIGEQNGPYISQFLYLPVPCGTATIHPEQTVPTAGLQNDFMTTRKEWMQVMEGSEPSRTIQFEKWNIVLRTPRDLAEYVHQDSAGQVARNAALILLSYGADALDANNPYLDTKTEGGGITFGSADVLNLVQEATQEALKAAWAHKWQVSRRLRPEEFGFQVQRELTEREERGIHPSLLRSEALQRAKERYGSFLLPMAYPEGSPSHPSYPAAHAVAMGAAITVLKAFFNEEFVFAHPMHPDAANLSLAPYEGVLTVGAELNKLASNIALGRDLAGVHYRSDSERGLRLGEKVALDLLANYSFLYHEDFPGFHLSTFDGREMLVGGKKRRSSTQKERISSAKTAARL